MNKFIKTIRDNLIMISIIPESCYLCWTGLIFDETKWSRYMKWAVELMDKDNGEE